MSRGLFIITVWLAFSAGWSVYVILDVTALPRHDPSWRPTDLDYDKWSMRPGDGKVTFGEQLLDVVGLLLGGLGLWSFMKYIDEGSRDAA
jgi:hypothetical protein